MPIHLLDSFCDSILVFLRNTSETLYIIRFYSRTICDLLLIVSYLTMNSFTTHYISLLSFLFQYFKISVRDSEGPPVTYSESLSEPDPIPCAGRSSKVYAPLVRIHHKHWPCSNCTVNTVQLKSFMTTQKYHRNESSHLNRGAFRENSRKRLFPKRNATTRDL
jgi:hypothetical protein